MLLLVALVVPWVTHGQTLNEGFEATGFPPDDWTTIHVSGANYFGVNTGAAYVNYASAGHENYLVTPKLTPKSGESLSFYVKTQTYPSTTLTIEVSTTGNSAADFTTTLATYNSPIQPSNSYVQKTIDLSAYVGQNIYIAFHVVDNDGGGVWIDDVSGVSLFVPSCVKPANLLVQDITATSATLLWEASGHGETTYQYLYTVAGGTPDWSAATSTTDLTVTLANLDPATGYDAYIRSYCSGGDQSAPVKVTFRTNCVVPFYETFPTNSCPAIWTTYGGAKASDVFAGTATLTSGTGGWVFSEIFAFGNYHARQEMYGGYNSTYMGWLVSPKIDLSDVSAAQLSFDAALTKYNSADAPTGASKDRFYVAVSTDDGATWSPLATWGPDPTDDYVLTDIPMTPTNYIVPLTAYAGGSIRLAFHGEKFESGGDDGIRIDNIAIEVPPSCPKPTKPSLSAATASSLQLSWTAGGDETAWKLRYKTTDATEWTEVEGTVSNPYTLEDLNANTEYYVCVQSYCSASDQSVWTDAVKFRTSFSCGEDYALREPVLGTGTLTSSTTPFYTNANNSKGKSWNIYNVSELADQDVYPGYIHGLSLQYASSFNVTFPVNIYIGETDKTTFSSGTDTVAYSDMTLVYSGDVTFEAGSDWTPIFFDTPAQYTGEHNVVVFFERTGAVSSAISFKYTSKSNASVYGYIGYSSWSRYTSSYRPNVKFTMCVDEPSCMNPLYFAVDDAASNSVDLVWTSRNASNPDGWQMEKTSGEVTTYAFVPFSAVTVTNDTVHYTATGLNENTEYTFRLREVCVTDEDISDWCKTSVTFRTDCAAKSLPYTCGFETEDGVPTTDGYRLPYCWFRTASSLGGNEPYVKNSNAHSGNNSLLFTSKIVWRKIAVLPLIDVAAYPMTGNRLDFWAKSSANDDSSYTLVIGTMTDPGDPETFVADSALYLTSTYAEYKIRFKSTGAYPAIMLESDIDASTSRSINVDDIVLQVAPSCEKPDNFAKGVVTSNAANLSWYDAAASAWQIEVTNTTDDDTVFVDVATVSRGDVNTDSVGYLLEGLQPLKSYKLRLRAVCGEGDTSLWALNTPTFTTLNNATDITAFSITTAGVQLGDAVIDAENHTIEATYAYGSDVTSLNASFTLSAGAKADINGEVVNSLNGVDFSEPLTLRVSAADTNIHQPWTITLVEEACARPVAVAATDIQKYQMTVQVTPNPNVLDGTYQMVVSTEPLTNEALASQEFTVMNGTTTIDHLLRDTTYYIYVRNVCGETYSAWVSTTAKTKGLELEAEIVTGSSKIQYFPWGDYYKKYYTQQIYTAEELTAQGLQKGYLGNVSFHYGLTSAYTKTVTIYMGQTELSSFPSTSFIPQGDLTQVTTPASVTFNADQWYTFSFDEPFYWDGESNIVVAGMYEGTNYPSNGVATFYGGTTTNPMGLYSRVDSGTPSTTAGTTSTNRANVRFTQVGLEACPAVAEVTTSDIATNRVKVSWTASEGDFANTYDIYYANTPVSDFEGVSPKVSGVEGTEYTLTGLTAYTDYFIYVRCKCDAEGYDDGYSPWVAADSIRTLSNCRPAQDIVLTPTSKTSMSISWVNGSYDAELGMASQPNDFWFTLRNAPLAAVSGNDCDIQGQTTTSWVENNLTPGATYYFYVANSCGEDGLSPFIEAHVTMPEACQAPADLQADPAKYAVNLSWTPDLFGAASDTYELIVSTTELGEEELATRAADSTGITGSSKTVNFLQRATDYYFYLRSNCGSFGPSNWASVATTTLDNGPDCENTVDVQIGDGTSTYRTTFVDNYDKYSYDQTLYKASELGRAGTIKSVSFRVGTPAASHTPSWTIYLGHTDVSTLTAWVPYSQLTQVATVNQPISQSGWYEIVFDEPFEYNGEDNLVLAVANMSGNYSTNFTFYYTSASGTVYHRGTDNSSSYGDPTNTTAGSASSYRANAKFAFCGEPVDCPSVEVLPAEDITDASAFLEWTTSEWDFAASYDIILSDTAVIDFENAEVTYSDIHATEYALNGLAAYTDYFVYVRAKCVNDFYNDGNSLWSSPVVTFKTQSSCNKPQDFEVLDRLSNAVTLVWTPGNASAWKIRRTQGENVDTIAVTSVTELSDGAVSYVVSGLEANTDYTFEIWADCSAAGQGESPLCDDVVEITTLDNSAYFTAFAVGSLFPTGCQMAPATIDAENGTINITVLAGTDRSNLVPTFSRPTSIDGIYVNDEYQLSGYTSVDFSNGPVSYLIVAEDVNVTRTWTVNVVEEACATAYDLSLSNVERRTMTLNWKAGADAENFKLIVSTEVVDDPESAEAQAITVAPAEPGSLLRSYNVDGLTRATTYHIYLKSACGDYWLHATATTKSLTFCNDIVIADGTDENSYVPIYGMYMDDPIGMQSVYPASMLTDAMGKTISSLHYYVTSTSASGTDWGTKPLQVYMAEVSDADLANGYLSVSDLTPVFDGNIVGSTVTPANGLNITLDQPFTYNGGNLLIAMRANPSDVSGWKTVNYYGVSVQDASRYGSGSANYNFTSSSPSAANFLPKFSFTYCEENEACPTVESAYVTDRTATGATLHWSEATGDYTDGYAVIVSNEPIENFEDAEIQYKNVSGTSLLLTDLNPYTYYNVYVRANCPEEAEEANQHSSWYPVDVFQTLSNCPVPEALAAELVATNAAKLSWTAEATDNFRYVLSTSELEEDGFDAVSPVAVSGDSVVIDGLEYSTNYFFYISRDCGDGDVSPWVSTSFTTIEACPQVVDLTVSNVSFNTAEVSWNNGTFCDAASWQVTATSTGEDPQVVFDQTVSSNHVVVFGLAAETEYSISVTALCGESLASEPVSETVTTTAVPGDCLTIGNGTSTGSGPICGLYGYERNGYIFTPEDGLNAGTILSLAWNYSDANKTIPAKIYLKHTDLSAFPATSSIVWNDIIADATLVYDNTFVSASGWNEIDITDFNYTGGNLMVLVASNKGGSGNASASAKYTTAGSNNHFYGRKDTSVDDDASISSMGSYSNGLDNQRHNIQFCFEPQGCPQVRNLAASDVTGHSAEISWLPGGSETAWNVAYANAEMTEDERAAAAASVSTISLPISGLNADADYYVYVQPVCTSESGSWSMYHFQTMPTCSAPESATAAVIDETTVHFVVDTELSIGTANAFNYEYWTVNTDGSYGDTITFNGDGDDTLSLNPFTTYAWRVRANCGEDDNSRWTEGNDVTTCGIFTVTNDNPFVDGCGDFPTYANCWSAFTDPDNPENEWTITTTAHNSGYAFSSYWYGDAYLVSPLIELPADVAELSFWSYNNYSSYYGKNSVLVANADLSSVTEIWSPESVSGSWVETKLRLSDYAGQQVRFVFKYEGDDAHQWILDDVKVSVIPTYDITVSSNNEAIGTVALTGDTNADGRYFASEVTAVATPTQSYFTFQNWTSGDDTISTNATLSFIPTKDTVITANFDTLSYSLFVRVAAGHESYGTVTGEGSYKYGTTHTIEAFPADNWRFQKWSDNNTENPRQITMGDANQTFFAYFEADYITRTFDTTVCDAYEFVDGNGTLHRVDHNVIDTVFTYVMADGRHRDTVTVNVQLNTNAGFTQTACDSYTWHDTVRSESGTYFYHYLTAQGCPSVDTLYLTINKSTDSTETITACDSYTWHGTTYTQSTTSLPELPTWTTTNLAGCDSVVSLALTINHNERFIDSISNCGPFIWARNMNEYTESGIYTVSRTDANGCVAIDSLVLTVNPTYNVIDEQSPCDSLTWINGVTYTYNVTTPQVTLLTVAGCDSILTLHLTLKHSNTGTDVQNPCDQFTWIDGNTYTEDNHVAQFTLTNADGCDSVVTLDLTLRHATNGIFYATACDSYTWVFEGRTIQSYTASNTTDTAHTVNVAGCDSIVTLNLTVNYSNSGSETRSECDSYTWNGRVLTVSGTYTDTLTNIYGCDSVATLYLTINYGESSVDTVTACNSYTWSISGETYTESGLQVHTATTAFGCPMIDSLYLTVNRSTFGSEYDTACSSFTWNGSAYTATGNYLHSYSNEYGCASVDTLHLTINQPTTGIDEQVACDTYTWIDGNVYTANNNTATYVLTNAAGCDSTVTLNLTMNYNSSTGYTETACDSYTWELKGETYTESGTYYREYETEAACSSVDTLYLTINNSTHNVATETACGSFAWHSKTYTASCDTVYRYTNAAGCASVDTLHLTINMPTTGTDEQVACDTYTWIDGNVYTESNNTATYVLTNAAGCDSTVTLNLTMNHNSSTGYTVTACDSYTWELKGETYTESGTYYREYETEAACPSVDTLYLTINHSSSTRTAEESCDKYVWHGTTYTTEGQKYFPYTSVEGCPSVDTLDLTLKHNTNTAFTDEGCESYVWSRNGQTYTTSGTYTYRYTAENGCESFDTLHLSVYYNGLTVKDTTVCDRYVWNGQTYTVSGAYEHLYELGACTGIDSLYLTVNRSTESVDPIVACDSYEWNGTTYVTSTNTPTHTITNVAGCDSVITLNLTINTRTTGTDIQTACDSYTWIDGNTYTANNRTATFTLENAAGCDSIVTLNLTVNRSTHNVTTQTACESYTWNGMTFTESCDTVYRYENAQGCASVDTLHLTVNYGTFTAFDTTVCDSYTWHEEARTATDEYVYTYTNEVNCPSADTLHLTVNTTTRGTDVQTACDSYTWIDGNTYTANNRTATFTLENEAGCDSIVTLNLTVNRSTHNVTTQTACESYTWNGMTFTESCDTVYRYENAQGCASVDTLHLTVNYGTFTAFDTTVCDNIVWHGQEYNASADVTYSFTNEANCPSTDTMHLSVNYTTYYTDVQTACDSYTWINSRTYTASTNAATYTTENVAGCDSVITLNLTINRSSAVTNDVQTACDSYTWPLSNRIYTESTTDTVVLTNMAGCDSAVVLRLTVNYNTNTAYTDVACDSYTWTRDRQTYTESGDYIYQYSTAQGCASFDTLHLTVNHNTNSATTETACDSYTWNGSVYTESGDYTYDYETEAGCASTDTLHLTVNYSTHYFTTKTACDSFTWNDMTFTASCDTVYRYTNESGCASVDTLHLTINNSTHNSATETVCDAYTWNGMTFTESCDTVYRYTNEAGCASVDTLHLTVNYSTHDVTTETACDSYVWNDMTFTASCDTVYRYTNAAGCASVDTLHLTLNNSTHNATTATACDRYTWNGMNLTASCDTVFRYTNADGCASVDTLHLTVNHSTHNGYTVIACDTFTWAGRTFSTSVNNFMNRYTNEEGCASVDTLHLTINYSTHDAYTESACEAYTWHGEEYLTSGTYTYDYTNAAGCASTDSLHLTINHGQGSKFIETACDSYNWNNNTYTMSGTYYHDFSTSEGCNAIDTLVLTVNYSTHNVDTETACDSYSWNGELYTVSGTYEFNYTNADGCASTDTLHLTVNYSTHDVTTETACESYSWNGMTFTASCDTVYRYTNADGCASVDTLHLTVNYGTHNAETETACDVFVWHGQFYTTSGDHTYSYTNEDGCASVDTLHLTVKHSTHNAETDVACNSYSWNGMTLTASCDTVYRYTNEEGCASVDTLHLTVNYSTYASATETACESYTWNGDVYTTSGVYTYDYTNEAGCASTDTLHLTVNYGTHNAETETACDVFVWHGQFYTTSGDHTYSYTNEDGCASVDTLHLTVNNSTHNAVTETACDSYTWNGSEYTESGDYTYSYTNADGCASVDTLHLTINHGQGSATTQAACESFTWNGSTYTESGVYYYDHTDEGCPATDTLNLTINHGTYQATSVVEQLSYTWNGTTYTATGDYTYNYNNEFGCASTDTLHLTIVGTEDFVAPVITDYFGMGLMVNHYPTDDPNKYVDYLDYRWYHNGEMVAQGADSYLDPNGVLDGTYYVEVPVPAEAAEGVWVRSNELRFRNGVGIDDVQDNILEISLAVAPNPVRKGAVMTVSTDLPVELLQGATLTMFDANGRNVMKMAMEQQSVSLTVDQASGIYTLQLTTKSGKQLVKKVVVR